MLDKDLSGIERTKRAIFGAMQGLVDCLTFTVETEEDFSDGWLPTLDIKLRIDAQNQIQYSFFEKPTGSDRCLQASTALNQNCLVRSLNNEVMRRVANMSAHIEISDKVKVLDKFCQKMTNSGHTLEVVRRSMLSGIKGHLRKAARCKTEKPFHRTAAASARSRKVKKLMQKQNWFKSKASYDDDNGGTIDDIDDRHSRMKGMSGRRGRVHGDEDSLVAYKEKTTKTTAKKHQPSTVLFCEYSKGGVLQSGLRGVVDRLAPMVGFNMRVTERAGTTLGSLLSNKILWTGDECGRQECKVCLQTGNKKEDCIRRNILYESECVRCVSSEMMPTLSLGGKGDNASLYVGESARSLFERSTEHWQAALQLKEESHMFQHMVEVHKDDTARPEFKFKVVRSFKSALDRQVAEAIRIEMRGNILNRKGEFNRCSLTRLGVDQKWEDERYAKSLEKVECADDDDETSGLVESRKTRREGEDHQLSRRAKRMKRECDGVVWGEQVEEHHRLRVQFLESGAVVAKKNNMQPKLNVLTGTDWMIYQLVKELTGGAVDRAWCLDDVAMWEEWGVTNEECDRPGKTLPVSECGTTQSQNKLSSVQQKPKYPIQHGGREVGGSEVTPILPKRGGKKKQVGGVTKNQRSVNEYFSKKQIQENNIQNDKLIVGVQCEPSKVSVLQYEMVEQARGIQKVADLGKVGGEKENIVYQKVERRI